jgi:cell division protease FtsH
MAGISDGTLDAVDGEVRRITDECYAEARKLLSSNRVKLDRVVEELLKHETLDEADVYAAAGIPHPPPDADVHTRLTEVSTTRT